MPKQKEQINKKIFFQSVFIFAIIFILLLSDVNIPCFEKRESFGFQNIRENAVVIAVKKVSPAVVNISSEYEVQASSPFSGFGMDPFFDSFFRDFFERGFERRYKKNSLGSGVIIDGKRGFILTNAHVITKTGKITVLLKDEREIEAQIVGADPDSDLAVLRISSDTPLPSIEMGNSDDLMIGETVIAIGNPFGFSHTVTTGVISSVNRSVRTEERVYHDFIQTDASINPGNSGGPLLNINGELIGINTAIYAKAQGIGFAIPINKAKRIVSDLIRYGEVVPAWIGITVQDIDARLAQYLKKPGNRGVLVKEIEKKSPAQKADIHEGDIILSMGNTDIRSSSDYYLTIKGFATGDTIEMRIWRENKDVKVSVKAAEFPLELAKELGYDLLGIKVEDISDRNFSRSPTGKSANEGVLISEIQRGCYLARIGVMPGDIIRQIDDITIKNVKDFEKAVVKYRNKVSVVILLYRGTQGYYITVSF